MRQFECERCGKIQYSEEDAILFEKACVYCGENNWILVLGHKVRAYGDSPSRWEEVVREILRYLGVNAASSTSIDRKLLDEILATEEDRELFSILLRETE
jgi:predicted  nucleic acid-binding Zn-ribbon protein